MTPSDDPLVEEMRQERRGRRPLFVAVTLAAVGIAVLALLAFTRFV